MVVNNHDHELWDCRTFDAQSPGLDLPPRSTEIQPLPKRVYKLDWITNLCDSFREDSRYSQSANR